MFMLLSFLNDLFFNMKDLTFSAKCLDAASGAIYSNAEESLESF